MKSMGKSWADLFIHIYKVINENYLIILGEGLSTRACSDRAREKGLKLKKGNLGLDIKNKFFT